MFNWLIGLFTVLVLVAVVAWLIGTFAGGSDRSKLDRCLDSGRTYAECQWR